MFAPLAKYLAQLDSIYRDSYFVNSKARLLATFNLVMLTFLPLNIFKIVWFQLPETPARVVCNGFFILASLLSLRWLRQGKLALAGNGLVLICVVPVQVAIWTVGSFPHPLAAAFQNFIFDLILLLVALVFASRSIALLVFGVNAVSHFVFYRYVLQDPIAGTLSFAAESLMREGLITMGFVFVLGTTLIALVDASRRRSEAALQKVKEVNENLERLVSARTKELEAATVRANQASRAKSDFLANMSHEIRTPLHGVIASSELLLYYPNLPPAAHQQAQLIAESGDLLLRLISDILDFSKIEAGQLKLEEKPFELISLMRDSVVLMQAKASAASVALNFTLDPQLSRGFVGDKFRLQQILLNLLSNALKFTPAGGQVHLTVALADPAADPSLIRFEVKDTGIGMDANTRQRVFDRFFQADASARSRGGAGLGLAISASLVSMMGGSLEVQSEPDRGSRFYFSIPLPSTVMEPTETTNQVAWTQFPLRVLIAEDNAINRRLLQTQLEKFGCQTLAVADGQAALLAAVQEPIPDLIFMDCDMPILNGLEATCRIRAWANSPEASGIQKKVALIPVIALTADTSEKNRVECEGVGMTDFLAKPVKLAQLQAVLERTPQPGETPDV